MSGREGHPPGYGYAYASDAAPPYSYQPILPLAQLNQTHGGAVQPPSIFSQQRHQQQQQQHPAFEYQSTHHQYLHQLPADARREAQPLPYPVSCQPSRGLPGSSFNVYLKCSDKDGHPEDLIYWIHFGHIPCRAYFSPLQLQSQESPHGLLTAEVPNVFLAGSAESFATSLRLLDREGHVLGFVALGNFAIEPSASEHDRMSPKPFPRKRKTSSESAYTDPAPSKKPSLSQLNPNRQVMHTATGEIIAQQLPYRNESRVPESAAMSPLAEVQPKPSASSSYPPLYRTSSTQPSATPSRISVGQQSQSFNPYSIYPGKAELFIDGSLEAMTEDWSNTEKASRRRLVEFQRVRTNNTITTTFKPVTLEERKPNSICVSCIWWAERQEAFVTSVDMIYLLESLVAVRFTVEEKNRIRRNLEGFHPLTVAKGREESDEFFKIIMGYPNPKPRNIEKDVKVFPWSILTKALKKIIGKYSSSYSSTAGHLHPQSSSSYGGRGSPLDPEGHSPGSSSSASVPPPPGPSNASTVLQAPPDVIAPHQAAYNPNLPQGYHQPTAPQSYPAYGPYHSQWQSGYAAHSMQPPPQYQYGPVQYSDPPYHGPGQLPPLPSNTNYQYGPQAQAGAPENPAYYGSAPSGHLPYPQTSRP